MTIMPNASGTSSRALRDRTNAPSPPPLANSARLA